MSGHSKIVNRLWILSEAISSKEYSDDLIQFLHEDILPLIEEIESRQNKGILSGEIKDDK